LYRTFASPIYGVVVQKSIFLGNWARTGEHLITVANLNSFLIVCQVNTDRSDRLRRRDLVTISLAGYEAVEIAGEVRHISHDEVLELTEVYITFATPSPGHDLSNMRADLTVYSGL